MFGDAELGELTWIHSFSNVFSVLFSIEAEDTGSRHRFSAKGEHGKRKTV